MIGKFHLPISSGGSPDPVTYCPANGYILNPINPADGWVLLAEFQTNSPNSTTFDPTITASSGDYSWDLGDGTMIIGDKSASHTYLTNNTWTVKLYGKNTTVVTSITADSDNIVGTLDLTNDAFESLTLVQLNINASLTNIIFASVITGTFSSFSISSTGITGTLDLSMFTTFTATANIGITANPNLTGVIFASSITGTFSNIQFFNCNITGVFDLSKFSSFTTSAIIHLATNQNLTGVTFASSITGTFSAISIYACNLTGVFDLSKFAAFTTSAAINLYSNSNLTNITFASSITGTFVSLFIYSTGITGTLDLSKFTAFTTVAILRLHSNPSMTGITFASAITGTISEMSMYSTGITGVLDLSKFTTWNATAGILNLQSNTSLTNVTFPVSTITGFIRTLRLDGCTSLGFIDLTKLKTGINSLGWQFQNNGWTAAIVNQMLVQIDTMSVGGFTGRVINIGGTNADPDTTSGGYNGSAARTSLQGKGFTVTIT